MTLTPQVWDGVLRRLRAELPSFTYEAWLEPLVPEPVEAGLVLLCPSAFHRDRVRNHYLPAINEHLASETGAAVGIELKVSDCTDELKSAQSGPAVDAALATEGTPGPDTATTHHSGERPSPAARETACGPDAATRPECNGAAEPRATHRPQAATGPMSAKGPRLALVRNGAEGLRSAPARSEADRSRLGLPYTFDSFVVGPCNALAREASLAIAREQQRTLNQLYISSGPGLGKTHLSRAVAAEARRLGGEAVTYVSAERFTNEFLAALRSRKTGDFKRKYRKRRQLLVFEDIQFLQSKDATQLEFFHTVQHVLDAGGRVVLTADRMPHEIGDLGARVRSQLATGFVAELEPPDAAVRRAILRSKAAHGGVRLPPECLDMLVEAAPGSVRELESVLIQLVTTASLLGQAIDADLTSTAIAKKVPTAPSRCRMLDVATVIGVVAGFFQTSPAAMASRSRGRAVLVPRQLAMYLCRRYTDRPVAEIGRALGRNHPSVRNAITKIERDILERPRLRYQVEALCERLDELKAGP